MSAPFIRICALSATWLVTLGLTGCLDNKVADLAVGVSKVFIAQRPDFYDFSEWMVFEHDVEGAHGSIAGTTNVYLKKMPPEDATEFPVGTVIVKTMQAADTGEMSIHAMTKRGGGFNPKGAMNWEFFELSIAKKDGKPFWVWRGEKPPTGEMYQMLLGAADLAPKDAEDNCNSCHANEDSKDGTFGDLADLLK